MKKNKITVDVFKDEVCEDGCIHSGPRVDTFKVASIDDIQPELELRYGTPFRACADGSDGMFENSDGYGECLVSNIRGKK